LLEGVFTMFRRITMSLAVLGLGIVPTIVSAQSPPRNPAVAPALPAEAARPAINSQANAADAFFARWLIIDNQNEIELAKLAEQKTKDAQVKEFAQLMIQDHQRMIDQLSRFVGETGESRASTAPASTPAAATAQQRTVEQTGNGSNRIRTEAVRDPARAPAGQGTPERRTAARVTDEGLIPGQGNPQTGMLALKQELAEECRNSARHELDRKDGKEFDECFIGMQLAGHMMAIDTMKVFQRHASDGLQQTIADGVKTAEGHFAMAKKIIHQQTEQQSKSEK
jgi:predicted outer membrane protein